MSPDDLAAAIQAIRGARYRPLSDAERDFFAGHLRILVERINEAIARTLTTTKG